MLRFCKSLRGTTSVFQKSGTKKILNPWQNSFSGRNVLGIFQSRMFSTKREGKLFDKILIANRGEIACRVITTCKKLGIKTVAVYSQPDMKSKHVEMADEGYFVGPAASSESYLRMDKILQACKDTGAQAVHPGYGFLSENTEFCDLLEKAGITFIGPKPRAIHAMGLKIESKLIAKEAKVNCIPGYDGEVTEEEVTKIANEIGYPVMIKASAGGGGKGMRIAWNDKEAIDGFKLSKQEAIKSFANDSMLIEKFIEEPRHVEIQVLLDSFGNGVYLNERECSIQRRNQKVIEEAPSPFVIPEMRKAMGEQAIQLAKAVDYQSAGTVEFLVDKHRNFYFLEMNTRLQVEHPITEYISGVDLVEQMIRIASGQKLLLKQEDIPIKGWALEARVYAEDPYRNFLPSIGRLNRYIEPQKIEEDDCDVRGFGSDVRCDSGVKEGSEISMYYDPLICKLVTHGKDRIDAIRKMENSLDSYVIRGVNHNICFLRAVMEKQRYLDGNTSTNFIPEEFPEGFKGTVLSSEDLNALIASAFRFYAGYIRRNGTISGQNDSFDFSNFALEKLSETVLTLNDENYKIKLNETEEIMEMFSEGENIELNCTLTTPNGEQHEILVSSDFEPGDIVSETDVNGKRHILQLIGKKQFNYDIQFHGTVYNFRITTPQEFLYFQHMLPEEKIDFGKLLISPMPGSVISVNVNVGDKVVAGQDMCVVEAMKMQNTLRSEVDAIVSEILIKPGESIATDQILLKFE